MDAGDAMAKTEKQKLCLFLRCVGWILDLIHSAVTSHVNPFSLQIETKHDVDTRYTQEMVQVYTWYLT